jgi:hypothetical protein
MISLALALLLQAAPVAKAPKVAPVLATPLAEDKLAAYRAAIRPDAEELAYLEIDWKPTLLAGLAEAQKADKPLLFWAVHGQPFGCV